MSQVYKESFLCKIGIIPFCKKNHSLLTQESFLFDTGIIPFWHRNHSFLTQGMTICHSLSFLFHRNHSSVFLKLRKAFLGCDIFSRNLSSFIWNHLLMNNTDIMERYRTIRAFPAWQNVEGECKQRINGAVNANTYRSAWYLGWSHLKWRLT